MRSDRPIVPSVESEPTIATRVPESAVRLPDHRRHVAEAWPARPPLIFLLRPSGPAAFPHPREACPPDDRSRALRSPARRPRRWFGVSGPRVRAGAPFCRELLQAWTVKLHSRLQTVSRLQLPVIDVTGEISRPRPPARDPDAPPRFARGAPGSPWRTRCHPDTPRQLVPRCTPRDTAFLLASPDQAQTEGLRGTAAPEATDTGAHPRDPESKSLRYTQRHVVSMAPSVEGAAESRSFSVS